MDRKIADWTVMVYLAGDNNLTAECIYALTEMKKVDLQGRVNVIVQFDPKDDYLPTRRFEITNDPKPGKLLRDNLGGAPFETESDNARRRAEILAAALKQGKKAVVDAAIAAFDAEIPVDCAEVVSATAKKELGERIRSEVFVDPTRPKKIATETDTGSPTTLYNFMSFCVQKFEANHYMVVLSGHGSGTEQDFLLKDESPDGSLTLNELKQAFQELKRELRRGQKIDILGLDACLMSMAEVCYELKDFVEILIGSEGYSPASGWPYQEILDRLVQEPKDGSGDIQDRVAIGIVEEYVNFYADYWLGGLSVDQSALKLAKADELKSAIDALANTLREKLEVAPVDQIFRDALILAHWEAQSYNGEQFVDLLDFCQLLMRRYTNDGIPQLCQTILDVIGNGDNRFVLKSCYNGPTYQYSHGVSIYFPWAQVAPSYGELDFTQKDSGWAEFLRVYTSKTRRMPRITEATSKLLNQGEIVGFESVNSSRTPQMFRKTDDKGTGNAVQSMRNPPLFALPDDCIRERANIIKELERFFAELLRLQSGD